MIRTVFPVTLAIVAATLTILVFVLPTPDAGDSVKLPDENEMVIRNVRLMENSELAQTSDIHIRDGVIIAIGSNLEVSADAETFDATGLTAIPGLIDSHTHSYGSALEDAARFGVTTQMDMFSEPSSLLTTRARRESVERTNRADLFSAGMLATATGGHGTQYGIPIDTLNGPEDAANWVAQRKAQGSDYIKLVYMPGQNKIPSIDRGTAKAVIDAAHANGLLAVAHISTQAAAHELIEDGIDGLVHIFADSVATPEFVALAKSRNVFFIPTLVVIASADGRKLGQDLSIDQAVAPYLSAQQNQSLSQQFPSGVPGFSVDTALRNVRLLHQAKVDILAGTDAPNPGTAHGASLYHEMELLVQAGLGASDALAAATSLPAQRFSLMHRGELAVGSRADLVLLNGNPVEDIVSIRAIGQIMKNGRFLSRQVADHVGGAPFEGKVLGVFDSSEMTHGAFEWSETTDSMSGGKSQATVELVKAGEGGTAYALRIGAQVNAGFPYPWAGAAVTPSTGQGARDISHFSEVSFSVRGTPGSYRLMVFSGTGGGIPPMQDFEISELWQRVTLSLGDFPGFEPASFFGFAFVAGPDLGNFEFLLDTIEFAE